MQETTPEQLVCLARMLPKKGFSCITDNDGLCGFKDQIYKKTHYEGVLFLEEKLALRRMNYHNRYSMHGLSHKPIFRLDKEKHRFMVDDDSALKRYVGADVAIDGLYSQSIFTPMLIATIEQKDTATARDIVRAQLEILLDDAQPCEAIGIYAKELILYSNPLTASKLFDADMRMGNPEFDADEQWDILFSTLKSLK